MIRDHDYDYENPVNENLNIDNLENRTQNTGNAINSPGSEFVSKRPKKIKPRQKRRDVNKVLIAKGQEHESAHKINGVFKKFPARPRRDEQCVCRCKNNQMLTEDVKERIHNDFRNLPDGNSQKAYLRGLTTITDINLRGNVYEHKLQIPGRPAIKVCQKYFCGIFGFPSRKSLTAKVLNQGVPINDLRGRHEKHRRIDPEIRGTIRRFLGTFPSRASHYSGNDNQNKKYLDAHLTIAELHRIYFVLYPEHAGKISYNYFNYIFNYEFNLDFGTPRSDVCNTCDKLQSEIISNRITGDEERVRQLHQNIKSHWQEAEAFYNKVRQARDLDETTAALCIDFEAQQPFPKTSTGEQYYVSELSIQTFCAENIKTGDASFYLYPENFSQKGSCEVIAFLNNYINNLPSTTRHLVLFCDNCGGQNKNRSLFAFAQFLVDTKKFQSITINYPIPGHSRLPCDRIFGLVQKLIKKQQRILTPSDYTHLIKRARIKNPITIKYANFNFTDNLLSDGNEVITVKKFGENLEELFLDSKGKLRKIRVIKFFPVKVPQVSYTEQEIEWCQFHLLKPNVTSQKLTDVMRDQTPKYNHYIEVSQNKYHSVHKLLKKQILPSTCTFYTSISPESSANAALRNQKQAQKSNNLSRRLGLSSTSTSLDSSVSLLKTSVLSGTLRPKVRGPKSTSNHPARFASILGLHNPITKKRKVESTGESNDCNQIQSNVITTGNIAESSPASASQRNALNSLDFLRANLNPQLLHPTVCPLPTVFGPRSSVQFNHRPPAQLRSSSNLLQQHGLNMQTSVPRAVSSLAMQQQFRQPLGLSTFMQRPQAQPRSTLHAIIQRSRPAETVTSATGSFESSILPQ